ncbi:MAG TPA: hypothetical protein VD994_20000 [Prosthecobacter sp.]|nr:hypothetical protein [Prosthecobacter sp.]
MATNALYDDEEAQQAVGQQPSLMPSMAESVNSASSPDSRPHILGFNAFKASKLAGGRKVTDRHGTRYLGGKVSGEPMEVDAELHAEYAALSDDAKAEWEARGTGDNLKQQGASAVQQLPPAFARMPNAPDLAGPLASRTAGARFMQSVQQVAARNQAATAAAQALRQQQIAHPEIAVDSAIAARDARLAESGITDMGGGTRVMSNQYGTGISTKLTPEQIAQRRPALIIDEKGVVDTAKMMANKGTGTTVPYLAGTQETPALNMDRRDEVRSGIQAGITAAVPGAGERRAADRAKSISNFSIANQPVMPAHMMAGSVSTTPNSAMRAIQKAVPPVGAAAVSGLAGGIPVVGPVVAGLATNEARKPGGGLFGSMGKLLTDMAARSKPVAPAPVSARLPFVAAR